MSGVGQDWWFRRRPLPRLAGPFVYRDYRSRSSNLDVLLAMFAELYHRDNRESEWSRLQPVVHGALRFPWGMARALRHRGPVARRVHGRSLPGQARDMWRAWWRTGLSPRDFYEALLPRHGGEPEVTHYIHALMLDHLIIELQLDLLGEPPFRLNDKVAFGRWRARARLPGPPEVFVVDGRRLDPSDLSALGPSVMVKPRDSGSGDGVEAWGHRGDGSWRSGDQELSTIDLVERINRRAAGGTGLVVQERMFNHPDIVGVCGETLATCRIVTVRNEDGEPEPVEFIWRMATDPDSVVDNYHAGGIYWATSDMVTGVFGHGVSGKTGTRQRLLADHPVTGARMAGTTHPFWPDARALALRTHGELADVLHVGWDIATTPDGPMLVEMNVPSGSFPRSFMSHDGIEHSRYGELLAWHARRWIDRNVPEGSRGRVGSGPAQTRVGV